MDEKNFDINLRELESDGEYVFVYVDRHNVFFILKSIQSLYLITTDKYLRVEDIEEISLPENFFDLVDIKFFKPTTNNNSSYKFIGIVEFEESSYRFCISNGKLEYQKEDKYNINTEMLKYLKFFKNTEITQYIQKGNNIYAIGFDVEYKDYFYTVVDVTTGEDLETYSLSSYNYDIVPKSITIDTAENKVYIVGGKRHVSNNPEKDLPYYNTFELL